MAYYVVQIAGTNLLSAEVDNYRSSNTNGNAHKLHNYYAL